MNSNYNIVTIAALLHDIGKVGQRSFDTDMGLSSSTKSLEEQLCPFNEKGGHRTHKHVLYTYEFCDNIATSLPDNINLSDLANLASYHHRPTNDPQRLIQDADRLSSAMERESVEDSKTYSHFKKILLTPVLSQVRTNGGFYGDRFYKYQLGKFSPDGIFPHQYEKSIDQTGEYHKLWTELLEKFKAIAIRDPLKYANTILSLLEKYTWAVPSATNVETPDISLFDHMKTTSAISGCLHLAEDGDKPFILAAGDFGAIQNYIFNFSGSKGRAKTLRGRSFQVGVFSDQLAMGILNNLKLTLAHLIISAGGRFYLLLPNNDRTREVLAERRARLHNWILEKKNGELRVNLAHIDLSKDDIKNFPASLKKINKALDDISYRGFVQLSTEIGWNESQWVRPGFSGTYQQVCSACQKNMVEVPPEGSDSRLCDDCKTDQTIGGAMVKNEYMEVSQDDTLLEHSLHDSSYGLLKDPGTANPVSDLIIDFHGKVVDKYDRPLFTILKNNYVPRDSDDNVLELSKIAEMSRGRRLLGILKADVDNLGFIFSRGLITNGDQKDRNSISRLTTMSRSLEYFFSGYMYHLLEKKFDSIYTVFSGGDDILLIGPWDEIHRFAIELYREFQHYTCYNNSWGLSAGIGIMKPRTPISAGNQLAVEYLRRSKGTENKNSITTMGTTMSWDDYEDALKQAQQLTEWMDSGVLNTSRVYRFLQYGERLKQFMESGNTSLLDVIPQMIYDLTRNWDDRVAKEWAHQYINPENDANRRLAFICQYALYLNREGGNE